MMRRRDKRPLIIGAFMAAFVFGFLTARFKPATEPADAASTAGFDPGNIISDYVMGNYSSMTETEIQAFLTSKNSCDNTSYSDYQYYTAKYPNLKWHWQDNHFVCLSQELFGDGEVIGSGETAAHIIWQAAQDYKINPQVLIVLLEKEQSLITDTYPNDRQYRAATGYGCPDTAACSEKYYGFKNQIRNAAAMFRTVLDGGWTNYPLGENYIQYNPDANCGGSVVNIKNLATSALYRYTPYQPNAGALAAGYGTATCGAYGNRNFYLYFTDWFGNPIKEVINFVALETPRYFIVRDGASKIDLVTNETSQLESDMILKFVTKVEHEDGWCMRTIYDTSVLANLCVPQKYLNEITLQYEELNEAQQDKMIVHDSNKTYIRSQDEAGTFSHSMKRRFAKSTTFLGKTYYITEYDAQNNNSEIGFTEQSVVDFEAADAYFTIPAGTYKIDIENMQQADIIDSTILRHFTKKILWKEQLYYQTEYDATNGTALVLPANVLQEEYPFIDFENPRNLCAKKDTQKVNPYTKETTTAILQGQSIKFTTKIMVNEQWYYRTEYDTVQGSNDAVFYADLEECR